MKKQHDGELELTKFDLAPEPESPEKTEQDVFWREMDLRTSVGLLREHGLLSDEKHRAIDNDIIRLYAIPPDKEPKQLTLDLDSLRKQAEHETDRAPAQEAEAQTRDYYTRRSRQVLEEYASAKPSRDEPNRELER